MKADTNYGIVLALYMTIILFGSTSCKREQSTIGPPKGPLSERNIDSLKHKPPSRPNIGNQLGQDTIVGNFTGLGIDSIWVVERMDTLEGGVIEYNYHTESNNPLLPSVELYGRSSRCAFIVNEGDINGDGKDEWGWMRGAFRSYANIEYHMLNFNNDNWLECVIDQSADTRNADIDIVSKGPKRGSIIVSFLYWNENLPDMTVGYDTIFNPFCDEVLLYEKP